MITKECFRAERVLEIAREIKVDPALIERTIYAFELLGGLVEKGIDLVFKGGTSLMLMIPELRRFSIDIDIVTQESYHALTKAFDGIVADGVFKRWEEDHRTGRDNLPKRHYKFYYSSDIARKELYILLDCVQADVLYPKTVKKAIALPFFTCDRKIEVNIPTINGLAGDKLTAFAPTTVGILYGQGKSMEIIKQLFDIGALFEQVTDLQELGEAYTLISKQEAMFRKLTLESKDFLNDTIKASLMLCQSGLRGCIENEQTRELKDGIIRIRSHTKEGRYTNANAKEDASRAACLASLVRNKNLDFDITSFRKNIGNTEQIKNMSLPDDYRILDKFKKIAPHSFHLWLITTGVIR